MTGITARKQELAVLQSIGMTTRQLQTMLAMEGFLYSLGAVLLALILIVVSSPILGPGVERLFWFFTYRFTIWSVAVVFPLFAVLGVGIPLVTCRIAQRYPVAERLRIE